MVKIVCVCVCVYACATACVEVRRQLVRIVLFFHHVGETQVVCQAGWEVSVLSHLIGPRGYLFMFIVVVHVWVQGLRNSQRTALHSRLPPPTLPWAPEIELGSLTLHSKHVLYPLPKAEPSSSYPWRCYRTATIFGWGIILVVDINMEERGRGQSGRNCRKED